MIKRSYIYLSFIILSLLTARIIQHEFEHTEGKLYIDHLSPFRKQLIKNKLVRIAKRKKHYLCES